MTRRSVIVIAHRLAVFCCYHPLNAAHFDSDFEVYDLNFRLSTIQAADRIVVMDGGHIVEVGEFSIYFL